MNDPKKKYSLQKSFSSIQFLLRHLVMHAMKTTIVIAIIVTSMACAIESRSSRTTRRIIPKPKVEQRQCKGKKCGIPATGPSGGRIVGGNEANPHSWPWQAFILCQYNQEVSRCGGSLISDRWIITAAHCLILPKMDILRDCNVWLGKHVLLTYESTQLTPNVTFYARHEKFNISNAGNGYDIALIKLAQPVKFTSAIQPINLPFGRPELPFNKSCIATGWGDTEYGNLMPSEKLMQLSLTVLDDALCRALGQPDDRVFCTTAWDHKKAMCHGDSGGPLSCKETDGKWYLRGVGSTVFRNCTLATYFTRVTSLEGWIKNLM